MLLMGQAKEFIELLLCAKQYCWHWRMLSEADSWGAIKEFTVKWEGAVVS